MSQNNPLDPIRNAHEEEYFHKKNQELIEHLREQLHHADEARKLLARTGVNDPHLMSWLAELGITAENAPILHLVPLFQVAWADGEIQPAERELLELAAAETGVQRGSPAFGAFEQLLTAPPSRGYYEAALIYIRLLLAALPTSEAESARENLQNLALQVARASGGLFGIFGRVDESERTALRQISAQLEAHPAASAVLKQL